MRNGVTRSAKTAVAILMIAGGLTATGKLAHSTQACRFVRAYHVIEKTDAPRNLWERLLYSYALAKAQAIS